MLEHFQDVRIAAQTITFLALALASWRWGAAPERAAAAVLVWFRLADWAYHGLFASSLNLTDIDTAHAVIDIVACIACFAIAVAANRIYPLWFAAFQLLAVGAHLARDMAVDVLPMVYAIMFMAPSYFQTAILALGLWFHHRRVRRFGPYRSWRNFSNRSPAAGRTNLPNG